VVRSHAANPTASGDLDHSASQPTLFRRVKEIAGLLRDLGLIIGIPAIVSIGLSVYDLQNKAHETEIKALEAQDAVLKETQFDRAVALIKAQKEAYDIDRAHTAEEIAGLRTQLADSNNKIASVATNVEKRTTELLSLLNKTLQDSNPPLATAKDMVKKPKMKSMRL
jgi:hypothetical protein